MLRRAHPVGGVGALTPDAPPPATPHEHPIAPLSRLLSLFFFNDTATTEIYTLSLHDALPICGRRRRTGHLGQPVEELAAAHPDRKSTRLNSSHGYISYAVFCLKKKKNNSRHNAIRNRVRAPSLKQKYSRTSQQ